MGNTMPDTIEEDAQYSELYAKWAPRVAGKQQAMVTQMGEDATAGIGSYPVLPMEDAPREEPLLQQATPATTEAIANAAGMERLDKYRICGRCQGMGSYKEYLDMGHGAMREITRMCDSDTDGAPCDGGIVNKNWREAKEEMKKGVNTCNKDDAEGEIPQYLMSMLTLSTCDSLNSRWQGSTISAPSFRSMSTTKIWSAHMMPRQGVSTYWLQLFGLARRSK